MSGGPRWTAGTIPGRSTRQELDRTREIERPENRLDALSPQPPENDTKCRILTQERGNTMYNLRTIMSRAWELRKAHGYTFRTALRLAWAEAKGVKAYTFKLDNARALITAYLMRLIRAVKDIHDQHKVAILRAALLLPCDEQGVAVADGKTVGVCKYAVRNA